MEHLAPGDEPLRAALLELSKEVDLDDLLGLTNIMGLEHFLTDLLLAAYHCCLRPLPRSAWQSLPASLICGVSSLGSLQGEMPREGFGSLSSFFSVSISPRGLSSVSVSSRFNPGFCSSFAKFALFARWKRLAAHFGSSNSLTSREGAPSPANPSAAIFRPHADHRCRANRRGRPRGRY